MDAAWCYLVLLGAHSCFNTKVENIVALRALNCQTKQN